MWLIGVRLSGISALFQCESLEKTLMLVKIEVRRRRGWQSMRCLNGVTKSMDMSLSKLREILKDREVWCSVVHGVTKVGHDLATEQQQSSLNYTVVQWLRLWASTAGGKGLILAWGTKISYAAWLGQKEMNHDYGMYGVENTVYNYVISLHGNILWLDCDHSEVYRNIESLCWVTGTHIVL